MTLGDFAERMAEEFGDPYSDTDVAQQYQRWCQRVYDRAISSSRLAFHNDTETVTLANGVAEYTLASTTAEIKDLHDTVNDDVIAYATIEELRRQGVDLEATGTPEAWHYSGVSSGSLKITVWPVPTTASIATVPSLQAYVLARPAALGTGDSLVWPDEFLWVLEAGVRALVHANDDRHQQAQYETSEYNAGMSILGSRYGAPSRHGSRMPGKTNLRALRQAGGTPSGS